MSAIRLTRVMTVLGAFLALEIGLVFVGMTVRCLAFALQRLAFAVLATAAAATAATASTAAVAIVAVGLAFRTIALGAVIVGAGAIGFTFGRITIGIFLGRTVEA